eukprot:gene12580-biopygen4952
MHPTLMSAWLTPLTRDLPLCWARWGRWTRTRTSDPGAGYSSAHGRAECAFVMEQAVLSCTRCRRGHRVPRHRATQR